PALHRPRRRGCVAERAAATAHAVRPVAAVAVLHPVALPRRAAGLLAAMALPLPAPAHGLDRAAPLLCGEGPAGLRARPAGYPPVTTRGLPAGIARPRPRW